MSKDDSKDLDRESARPDHRVYCNRIEDENRGVVGARQFQVGICGPVRRVEWIVERRRDESAASVMPRFNFRLLLPAVFEDRRNGGQDAAPMPNGGRKGFQVRRNLRK